MIDVDWATGTLALSGYCCGAYFEAIATSDDAEHISEIREQIMAFCWYGDVA